MSNLRPDEVSAYGAAGLSTQEAARRYSRDGPNELPVTKPPPAWKSLLAQMVHFFALMLWVAGALAFVAGMPQLGVAIFVVIVVNGVFAFAQESRAERAAERLRDLLPRRALVMRDGAPMEVDASELVVGDLVVLAPGDRVSADLIVVEAHALSIDTSLLTGESVPTRPVLGDTLFAGTFLVEGEGRAEVRATAGSTRLAGIAELTHMAVRPRGPLAKELDRVVRVIAFIAVGVGFAFFAIASAIGTPAGDGFLFAIGVTVALVPEGLLPTVTLALATGAQHMANQQALVRRLESVETLGSTTFICTDKTGTLTRNEMSVVEAWTPDGLARISGVGYEPVGEIDADDEMLEALRTLALSAVRCSTGRAVLLNDRWTAQGDPMDAAIDALVSRLGIDLVAEEQRAPVTRRFPFDPSRRRMGVAAGSYLFVKGAADSLLPCCREGDMVSRAAQAADDMATRGLRVLAVARRRSDAVSADATAEEAERDLELLGIFGLQDPPRLDVAEAIAACRRAGIRVAMVTGDHPATARAIAAEVGLLGPEELVLEGRSLPADDQVLGALLDHDGVVVSRVTPEDKLRIASALQGRGHVVAMTGDGVNDGPALRKADIGVAMGRSGTDVAREAADLVLLDDHFGTIVAAVEQGRATYANVRRFLTYHLTDNVAELTPFAVWALSGGRFPLAIGVLQILCLDIGTDLLPALALGAEPPDKRVMTRPPWTGRLLDGSVLGRVFGVLGPVEAAVEMAAFMVALAAAGWRPGDSFPTGPVLWAASGAAFSAVVIGQMGNAYACRSATRPVTRMGPKGNPLLLGAVVVEMGALAGFLLISPLASLLDQRPPPLAGFLVALSAAPAVIIADSLHKWSRGRLRSGRDKPSAGGRG